MTRDGKQTSLGCEVERPMILDTARMCPQSRTRAGAEVRRESRKTTNEIVWLCANNWGHIYCRYITPPPPPPPTHTHTHTHMHTTQLCVGACLEFDLKTSLFTAVGNSPLDADLQLVAAWPMYPQTTLAKSAQCVWVCVCAGVWVCVCVPNRHGFLAGLCWINEQQIFLTLAELSVWVSAGFCLQSFSTVISTDFQTPD